MTYYFNEDRAPNEPERCVLCGEEAIYDEDDQGNIQIVNLSYCSTCDEYFCPVDVGNWKARYKAAGVKAKKHLIEKFV